MMWNLASDGKGRVYIDVLVLVENTMPRRIFGPNESKE
jgi:hypothetical protein